VPDVADRDDDAARPPETGGLPPPDGPMQRALDRLADLQLKQPLIVLFIGLVSMCVAGYFATRLKLRTSFGELLPSHRESVIVADEVNERLPSLSTLIVVIEGSDNEGLKRMVDALTPELRKIPPHLAGQVDDGMRRTLEYFDQNKVLYAPLDLVKEVRDEIVERYEWEVAKRAGTLIDDHEPPPIDEATIRKRIEERQGNKLPPEGPQFPGGYYMSEKDHTIAIRIMTPLGVGDLDETAELEREINAAVERIDPKKFDPTARVGISGGLIVGAETYQQIKDDITQVGLWGVGLILGIVLLYYLRLRTVLAMIVTVAIGTSWTFGLTYLLVGHLHTTTGFLFSIVVGNGINFSIIYMARYLEARRTDDVAASVRSAHRHTWESTLTAAAAAGVAYGSLIVTDFRGFKVFGVIGGAGMVFCWLATFLFLPAILVVTERVWPIASRGVVSRLSGLYGRPFAAVMMRAPRAVVIGALLITAGAGWLSYRYVAEGPMEYDMNQIDNDVEEVVTEALRLNRIANGIVGRAGQDGLAIAVDRIDQVLPLKAELEKKRDAAARRPFDEVVTIYDFIPTDQEKKIKLAKEAREVVDRAHRRGFVSDEDHRKIDELIPVKSLRPLGIEDLPDQVAAPFTEVDGTRGRLVYIVPSRADSVWDGRYLIHFAESFRSTELPDGSVVKGSGRSVIFADMILAIVDDAPRAIIVSLILTVLIVVISFRGRRASLWVMASVFMGLCWMMAVLAIWRSRWPWEEGGFELQALKLNFFNFVALPISLGVGADYAVNVLKRYQQEGERNIPRVVAETGGAVVLCSLTTTLGYIALTMSVNLAVRSFGVAAAAGELCCLITGVVVLPACLSLLERRRKRQAGAAAVGGDA
jgi:predicted RND superfamily exporter protein